MNFHKVTVMVQVSDEKGGWHDFELAAVDSVRDAEELIERRCASLRSNMGYVDAGVWWLEKRGWRSVRFYMNVELHNPDKSQYREVRPMGRA